MSAKALAVFAAMVANICYACDRNEIRHPKDVNWLCRECSEMSRRRKSENFGLTEWVLARRKKLGLVDRRLERMEARDDR